MAGVFAAEGLDYHVTIKARFGSTVCALVTNGLGIAVIDVFTLEGTNWPDLVAIEITEPTRFETFVATRKDATLSTYCEAFVAGLQGHMRHVLGGPAPAMRSPSSHTPVVVKT